MRRYQEILASVKKFGDAEVAKSVELSFKDAIEYYQSQIQQGKTYVPHFSKLRS